MVCLHTFFYFIAQSIYEGKEYNDQCNHSYASDDYCKRLVTVAAIVVIVIYTLIHITKTIRIQLALPSYSQKMNKLKYFINTVTVI